MSQLLPIFVHLSQRPILVIGGGDRAEEKLQKLVRTGARITLVAAKLKPSIKALLATYSIEWRARLFDPSDLDGHQLCIVALEDAYEQKRISHWARAKNVLVNTVDLAEAADFYFGAEVHRGDLTIAISTNGLAPGIARGLRHWLEKQLPEALGDELQQINVLRQRVRQRLKDPKERMRLLSKELALWVERLLETEVSIAHHHQYPRGGQHHV